MTSLKTIIVDTTDALNDCLAAISPQHYSPVHIVVDTEGVSQGRTGKACIIQLFARGGDTVWLVDITTLKNSAFDHVDDQGRSLRGIFENSTIRKVRQIMSSLPKTQNINLFQYFYDVRQDSNVLYNLHQVSLAGVYDIQLLELATRACGSGRSRYLNGLKRSIEDYLPQPREWKQVKEAGLALFTPERGGRFEVFDERPLDPRLIAYCAQDVALFFQLEEVLRRKMGAEQVARWEDKIIAESAERVGLAYDPSFDFQGPHMALAPKGWKS
jgi:exonuclease 3'-5' domain-containing protein 1